MIVEFKPEHLESFKLQANQSMLSGELNYEYGKGLKESGEAFSCIKDGEIIACAGLIKVWENRLLAWALMTENALTPRVFLEIHKASIKLFEFNNDKRIEAYVDLNHKKAHEWIIKLGFELECKEMKRFLPNGSSQALYARVK